MTEKELQALIQLLDDPDDGIYQEVEGKLKSFGEKALPLLESAWHRQSMGDLFVQRIEHLISSMSGDKQMQSITEWIAEHEPSLLEGFLLVNKVANPDVDITAVTRQIESLRKEIWLELHDDLTAIEKLRIVNHFLFEVHGFKGNVERYHHINNSCLDKVLEHKTGNPLTLSILYLLIARELDISLFGINLPQHFILGYVDTQSPLSTISNKEQPEVLFFVDPFSGGNLFSLPEVQLFAKQLNIEPKQEHFRPCDTHTMVRRGFVNLMYSFRKQKSYEKVDQVKKIITAFNRNLEK